MAMPSLLDLRSLAYCLDETELLHVAGGEGSVKIVDKCNYWFTSHIGAKIVICSEKIAKFASCTKLKRNA